jgi:hypothetical protein
MLTRNALVTVVVDGESLGTFITKSGGAVTADGKKIRLGGMSDEVALGGPASVDDLTVTRLNDTFMQARSKRLKSRVGLASMSVTYTPLGNDKQPSGPSETYTGILNGHTTPEADDNSSDPAMVELVLLANQAIS